LRILGRQAQPALKEALRGEPPPELAYRARHLLEKLKDRTAAPNELRWSRAVEALERSDAPEAREFLQALADDASDLSLAREARAYLARLPAP